jgi:putative ABC transport system permease protein
VELNTIAGRLAAEYPEADKGWGLKVEPLHSAYYRQIVKPVIVISSAAFLVLLIACVNVANLLLVRSTTRRKEIAVRIAMGASRRRLISQLLTESVLLGAVGGGLGVLFSFVGVRLLAYGCKQYLGYLATGALWISLNAPVLAFCLGLAVLTGIVFGLVPALGASKLDVNEPLKESSGSVTAEAGRRRLRNGLVVCEVCLAMVLLVSSGLLIRTFVNVLNVGLGFDPHNVLETYLSLPRYKYKTPEKQAELFRSALERIRALPGVESASASLPDDYLLFNVEGVTPPSPAREPSAMIFEVSPGFFRTLRTPLIEGRDFTDADDAAAQHVAIIGQTLANRYFPHVDPIGHALIPLGEVWEGESKGTSKPLEIVGVVKDMKLFVSLRQKTAEIFVPFLQHPMRVMGFDIRTALPPATMVPELRGVVKSLDSELPLGRVRSLDREITREYGSVSFPYTIVWTFAFLALVLSAVGIFGVISYSVSQRTHEMAIRMALGASPQQVLKLVLIEALRMTGLGVLIGIPISLALGRLIQSLLFGVPSYDPFTLVSVTVVMAAVAALASYFPARRATKVDPLTALRHE